MKQGGHFRFLKCTLGCVMSLIVYTSFKKIELAKTWADILFDQWLYIMMCSCHIGLIQIFCIVHQLWSMPESKRLNSVYQDHTISYAWDCSSRQNQTWPPVFEQPPARSCLASLLRSCGCKACHVEGKGPVSSARDWNGSSGSSPSRTRQPGRETVRHRNRTNWSGSESSRFSSAIRRKKEVWNPSSNGWRHRFLCPSSVMHFPLPTEASLRPPMARVALWLIQIPIDRSGAAPPHSPPWENPPRFHSQSLRSSPAAFCCIICIHASRYLKSVVRM